MRAVAYRGAFLSFACVQLYYVGARGKGLRCGGLMDTYFTSFLSLRDSGFSSLNENSEQVPST